MYCDMLSRIDSQVSPRTRVSKTCRSSNKSSRLFKIESGGEIVREVGTLQKFRDGKSSDWYSGDLGEDHARCDNDASTYNSFGGVGVKLELLHTMPKNKRA
jgi:hypothetical protein